MLTEQWRKHDNYATTSQFFGYPPQSPETILTIEVKPSCTNFKLDNSGRDDQRNLKTAKVGGPSRLFLHVAFIVL